MPSSTGPRTIPDPTSTTTARITVRPQFAANLAFAAATGPLRRCDGYTAAMTIPAIRKDTHGMGMKERKPIDQETVPLAGGWEYAGYPYCGATSSAYSGLAEYPYWEGAGYAGWPCHSAEPSPEALPGPAP